MLVNQGKGMDFIFKENGVLMFHDRVCVPDVRLRSEFWKKVIGVV